MQISTPVAVGVIFVTIAVSGAIVYLKASRLSRIQLPEPPKSAPVAERKRQMLGGAGASAASGYQTPRCLPVWLGYGSSSGK